MGHRDHHRVGLHRDHHRVGLHRGLRRRRELTPAVPHPSVGDGPLGADRYDDPDDHRVAARSVARRCLAVAESACRTPRPVARVAAESVCRMLKGAAWHRAAEHGEPRVPWRPDRERSDRRRERRGSALGSGQTPARGWSRFRGPSWGAPTSRWTRSPDAGTRVRARAPAPARAPTRAPTRARAPAPTASRPSSCLVPQAGHRAPSPRVVPCDGPGRPGLRRRPMSGSSHLYPGIHRGRGPRRWSSPVLAPAHRRGCSSARWFRRPVCWWSLLVEFCSYGDRPPNQRDRQVGRHRPNRRLTLSVGGLDHPSDSRGSEMARQAATIERR